MTLILPPVTLRKLLRLKARAFGRAQLRRFRRPSGALFGVLGILLFGLWFVSLTAGRYLGGSSDERRDWVERTFQLGGGSEPEEARSQEEATKVDLTVPWIQAVCLLLTTMTVVGSLGHRGLYLPSEEIERLLSAPVARSDLVRYRLLINLGRSLFAGLIFGLLSLGRLPHPLFGFLGVFVAMCTLPLFGQIASLVAGDAENRVARWFQGGRLKVFNIVLALALWIFVMGMIFGDRLLRKVPVEFGDMERSAEDILLHPAVRVVLAPFRPWANLIAAEDLAGFATWLGLCAVLWVVLFEITARIPVDFRELSLETSADVARRIRRIGTRGLGASSGKVSSRAQQRKVPWLFGRGPFGAVAWLKLTAILRKARGTLIVSLGIVGLLTVAFTALMPDDEPREILAGASILAFIGTFYLCAGLRFDFRMDLDQMSSVKAWPLAPRKLFLATVLPEVLLVSALLMAAVAARAGITRAFHPGLLAILAFQPLFTLIWVSVDNAVFLFAPVRYVPGQEGALHHAGRSAVLWLVRMMLLVVLTGSVTFVGVLAGMGAALLGAGETAAFVVGGAVAWLLCAGGAALAVSLGGRMLRRFDLARDRAT